ncbi:MAG TPA: FAD-dependent oxidoreductase [Capsulimonadaceae bacterium]|jgi:hypothetical protein
MNEFNRSLTRLTHDFDVCVIGGGMAGICAAIASARNGAKTAIVHDRPVFGGNASSEIRMWIGGAQGKCDKETGILEEILLENQYRNPSLNYSIWDSVLYEKVFFQPNLTAFMNASCIGAEMDGDRIAEIEAWQLTSQQWHTISSKLFIDCSGDSILAALTPAESRRGREARSEFNEDIEPETGDNKTMGNSLLIQFRRTEEPQLFVAPSWAHKFTCPEELPHRNYGWGDNYWWIEVGGLKDTINDAEAIRDELMKVVYGVVDYTKNVAPDKEKAANWGVEWIGALPGKRENRRYIGDHVLTQNDVREGGKFDDIVAYGGWSMDDHHPAGIYYPGKPTIFHPAPSPYGIPYRSLYSRNVPNLLFAGRNISVTHAALSSTRVMATCAVIGQAVGTAAAVAISHKVDPRAVSTGPLLRELQTRLMDDDAWLPGILRPISPLAKSATLSSGGKGVEQLVDGLDRDRPDESHGWTGEPGQSVQFIWPTAQTVKCARIVFDSNLAHVKPMPSTFPRKGSDMRVPDTLVKAYRLEAIDGTGKWTTAHHETNNYQRLANVPLTVNTTGLRLVVESTWGAPEAHIYAFEPLAEAPARALPAITGITFEAARAHIAPRDLAAPDSGLEEDRKSGRGAA